MRLDQIEHATSNLPQHREVTALEDEARTLDTQLVNSRTALSDVQRDVDKFPRQGAADPWKVHQSYLADYRAMRLRGVTDGVMRFSNPGTRTHVLPERRMEATA